MSPEKTPPTMYDIVTAEEVAAMIQGGNVPAALTNCERIETARVGVLTVAAAAGQMLMPPLTTMQVMHKAVPLVEIARGVRTADISSYNTPVAPGQV